MRKSDRKRHVCVECGEAAEFPIEEGKWMCLAHITRRVHSPWNVALMEQREAAEDIADFLADGGRLS
jgi:hypothetical protein